MRRKIGRVDFELVVLDLTSPDLQKRLRLKDSDLVGDDLTSCQTLADLAADAGFEAILAPSAALSGEQTLAVFGAAIAAGARKVVDRGTRTAPANSR